jgi:hypothetical protein
VAISLDNRWVVTGSLDQTGRLWPLQINDLIDLARATVGRNFTADEWQLYFSGNAYHKTFPDLLGQIRNAKKQSSCWKFFHTKESPLGSVKHNPRSDHPKWGEWSIEDSPFVP